MDLAGWVLISLFVVSSIIHASEVDEIQVKKWSEDVKYFFPSDKEHSVEINNILEAELAVDSSDYHFNGTFYTNRSELIYFEFSEKKNSENIHIYGFDSDGILVEVYGSHKETQFQEWRPVKYYEVLERMYRLDDLLSSSEANMEASISIKYTALAFISGYQEKSIDSSSVTTKDLEELINRNGIYVYQGLASRNIYYALRIDSNQRIILETKASGGRPSVGRHFYVANYIEDTCDYSVTGSEYLLAPGNVGDCFSGKGGRKYKTNLDVYKLTQRLNNNIAD